jgi:hypothetical protein
MYDSTERRETEKKGAQAEILTSFDQSENSPKLLRSSSVVIGIDVNLRRHHEPQASLYPLNVRDGTGTGNGNRSNGTVIHNSSQPRQ